jgi:hypothetical protein
MMRALFVFSAACLLVLPSAAHAEDPYGLGPASSTPATIITTWGTHSASSSDGTSVTHDSPVTRARELLTRARFLDDAASTDEKAATDLASRLGALRTAAKTARERAERATPEEREVMGARAEDLETDVIVSEAEIGFKRKTAADNRRVARELRVRAVRLVRETPTALDEATANPCDPPFRFTADGRKVYRVECLK